MPFSIVRNDITKMDADAIVNSANPAPEIGGGSDFAVFQAAGADALLAARRKIGYLEPGEACLTRGFGLPARYVIHTVAPLWEDGSSGEEEILRRCYKSCLQIARKKHLRSVAFPLLAAGTLGFPKDKALTAALSSIQEFLMDSEMTVWLVVFDRSSFRLSEKLSKDIEEFIDDHYARIKAKEEYQAELFEMQPGPDDADFDEMQSVSGLAHADMAAPSPDEFSQARDAERIRERREGIRQQLHGRDQVPGIPSHHAPAKPTAAYYNAKPAAPHSAKKRSMDEVLSELGETFQQALMRMIRERGYDNKEVYKRANLDRKVFSKIKGNPDYSPKKSTAIALAVALRLNMDEARDLLGRAGYAFSPGSKSDLIVEYFIENGVYDVYTIDTALFEHDLPMLSNY